MQTQSSFKFRWLLWGGDLLTVLLFTLVGFATHDSLGSAGLRMLTTFVPLLAAWLFVALPSGLMRLETAANPRQLWRVAWAMLLVGPLAALLRGIWLNRPLVLVFVVVLSGSGLLAMLVWRGIFALLLRRLDK